MNMLKSQIIRLNKVPEHARFLLVPDIAIPLRINKRCAFNIRNLLNQRNHGIAHYNKSFFLADVPCLDLMLADVKSKVLEIRIYDLIDVNITPAAIIANQHPNAIPVQLRNLVAL